MRLKVERPTLLCLGFEWPITGDDNRNASVEVSYRRVGEQAWQQGMPLEVTGQHQSIDFAPVATWAQRRSLPLVVDLGFGGLRDVAAIGLEQPTAAAAIQAGASLVILRGDGLLGGPSCAVICGKSALISQLAAHPLMRTSTCDKSITAALEATLELYQTAAEQQPSSIERAIPLLGLLPPFSAGMSC